MFEKLILPLFGGAPVDTGPDAADLTQAADYALCRLMQRTSGPIAGATGVPAQQAAAKQGVMMSGADFDRMILTDQGFRSN